MALKKGLSGDRKQWQKTDICLIAFKEDKKRWAESAQRRFLCTWRVPRDRVYKSWEGRGTWKKVVTTLPLLWGCFSPTSMRTVDISSTGLERVLERAKLEVLWGEVDFGIRKRWKKSCVIAAKHTCDSRGSISQTVFYSGCTTFTSAAYEASSFSASLSKLLFLIIAILVVSHCGISLWFRLTFP